MLFSPKASIIASASVVGGKEHAGPLSSHFDFYNDQDRFGAPTWEKAESEMQRIALGHAMSRASLGPDQLDLLLAGDLLNQCTGSAFGLLSYDIPYLGLYGACSTSAEGLLLASLLVSGGGATRAAVVTSSHNAAAERQFRTPIEYGGQRPPTAQWTVTGAGAFIVTSRNSAPASHAPLAHITAALPGIVVDSGVTDQGNMGAAMAPAAASTLCRFFEASGRKPSDYDLIVTGDLGWEGGRLLCELTARDGLDISAQYNDCGMMIFSRSTQDTHCGGSGCGCAATVLAAYLLPRLKSGAIRRMLFMATGALMSPDSIKQGLAIPGVGHLIELMSPTEGEMGA